MSFARYRNDGLFVCQRTKTTHGYFRKGALGKRNNNYTDVFLVKSGDGGGIVDTDRVIFPNSLLGKRVRFKIEIIDESI